MNDTEQLTIVSGKMRCERVDEGAVWIDAEFRAILERAGWNRFDTVMTASEGHCWRLLPQRENWCFDLPDGRGRSCRVYLKKHHVRQWGAWLRMKLGMPLPATPARIETENVLRLRNAGIKSMRVIAFGERFCMDGLVESFFMTEELTGFLELPFFLVQRFPTCPRQVTRRRNRDLDRLMRGVAEVARKFHQASYNHRDLYGGHFFVSEPAPGRFEIRLIDLQRVQQRRWFRRRWVVKDLAQLAWSLPLDRISCTQRMAFLHHYLGVRRLRPCDKRLVHEVLAKQQRMQRRVGAVRCHSRPFGNQQDDQRSEAATTAEGAKHENRLGD
jgi:hypothetical protein